MLHRNSDPVPSAANNNDNTTTSTRIRSRVRIVEDNHHHHHQPQNRQPLAGGGASSGLTHHPPPPPPPPPPRQRRWALNNSGEDENYAHLLEQHYDERTRFFQQQQREQMFHHPYHHHHHHDSLSPFSASSSSYSSSSVVSSSSSLSVVSCSVCGCSCCDSSSTSSSSMTAYCTCGRGGGGEASPSSSSDSRSPESRLCPACQAMNVRNLGPMAPSSSSASSSASSPPSLVGASRVAGGGAGGGWICHSCQVAELRLKTLYASPVRIPGRRVVDTPEDGSVAARLLAQTPLLNVVDPRDRHGQRVTVPPGAAANENAKSGSNKNNNNNNDDDEITAGGGADAMPGKKPPRGSRVGKVDFPIAPPAGAGAAAPAAAAASSGKQNNQGNQIASENLNIGFLDHFLQSNPDVLTDLVRRQSGGGGGAGGGDAGAAATMTVEEHLRRQQLMQQEFHNQMLQQQHIQQQQQQQQRPQKIYICDQITQANLSIGATHSDGQHHTNTIDTQTDSSVHVAHFQCQAGPAASEVVEEETQLGIENYDDEMNSTTAASGGAASASASSSSPFSLTALRQQVRDEDAQQRLAMKLHNVEHNSVAIQDDYFGHSLAELRREEFRRMHAERIIADEADGRRAIIQLAADILFPEYQACADMLRNARYMRDATDAKLHNYREIAELATTRLCQFAEAAARAQLEQRVQASWQAVADEFRRAGESISHGDLHNAVRAKDAELARLRQQIEDERVAARVAESDLRDRLRRSLLYSEGANIRVPRAIDNQPGGGGLLSKLPFGQVDMNLPIEIRFARAHVIAKRAVEMERGPQQPEEQQRDESADDGADEELAEEEEEEENNDEQMMVGEDALVQAEI